MGFQFDTRKFPISGRAPWPKLPGVLVHDFTDPEWDTRFLGDLYQDLSEAAGKKYALLQTPEFVEEFILDRTLDPALEEFGLDPPPVVDKLGDTIAPTGFRMIDPACGSGHFLLGSFRRILALWQKREPAAKAGISCSGRWNVSTVST